MGGGWWWGEGSVEMGVEMGMVAGVDPMRLVGVGTCKRVGVVKDVGSWGNESGYVPDVELVPCCHIHHLIEMEAAGKSNGNGRRSAVKLYYHENVTETRETHPVPGVGGDICDPSVMSVSHSPCAPTG
jgi:hypothetical protein